MRHASFRVHPANKVQSPTYKEGRQAEALPPELKSRVKDEAQKPCLQLCHVCGIAEALQLYFGCVKHALVRCGESLMKRNVHA